MSEDAAPIDAMNGKDGSGKARLLTLSALDKRTSAYRKAAELISDIESDLGAGDRLSIGKR